MPSKRVPVRWGLSKPRAYQLICSAVTLARCSFLFQPCGRHNVFLRVKYHLYSQTLHAVPDLDSKVSALESRVEPCSARISSNRIKAVFPNRFQRVMMNLIDRIPIVLRLGGTSQNFLNRFNA